MEIEITVTEKRWIHHFLQYKSMKKKIQHSRANNSKVNNPIGPKFELIPSFYACPRYMQVWQISHQRWLRQVTDIIFFISQGHVTPKWLVRSGQNLNPSNISCLSLLPVSLMKTELTVKWRHHFLHYKSTGKNFCTQGWITPKWMIRSSPHSNSFKLLCLSSVPASLTKVQSKVTEKCWRHHFFTTQRHVTPKWLVRYDRNWNLSEILCLSSLPVSLMKTEFIITEKRRRHHFPHSKSMGMHKEE